MRTRKDSGFSLLEVMIVATIGTIVTATALPNMVNGIANMRLRSSLTSLAGVIQNCRMLSVKQNQTMTTHFAPTTTGVVAYVKQAADTSTYTVQDSQVELEAPVSQTTAPSGVGAPTALDPTVLGFTPLTGDPSFNTTGLPCAYNSGVCPNNGFVYYFHDLRPQQQQGWAALSISPAGRVKKWYWNGSDWTS
jgi:prepilin-type N-terminal cleavage/methylation domain-containing protein